MTLSHITLEHESVPIPPEISTFLRAADELVEQHRIRVATSYRGFVPSDYSLIYQSLKSLHDSELLTGNRFCEWGSGVGVVTSLAAMIGFESFGIEYDANLCAVAEGMCADFDVAAEVVNGSFIPEGVEDLVDVAYATHSGELALHTDPDRAYDELGYDIDDFDLVFVYPWPNDVELTCDIFDRCAAQGALLLVYHEGDAIALFRKD